MNQSFEKIYEDSYNKIIKYVVSKCNDLSYVEDIMQNIYLKLFKALKRNSEINDIDSYLFIIAKREVIKYYDLKTKFKNMFDETDFSIFENISPSKVEIETEFINNENKEEIWNEIKNEDLVTQKILVLYFIEEIDILSISRMLDMNESTVKSRLYRTIKKMRERFGDNE